MRGSGMTRDGIFSRRAAGVCGSRPHAFVGRVERAQRPARRRHFADTARAPPRISDLVLLPASPLIGYPWRSTRSEEHTSELQSQSNIVCRLLLEKKKNRQVLEVILYTTTRMR